MSQEYLMQSPVRRLLELKAGGRLLFVQHRLTPDASMADDLLLRRQCEAGVTFAGGWPILSHRYLPVARNVPKCRATGVNQFLSRVVNCENIHRRIVAATFAIGTFAIPFKKIRMIRG